MKEILTVLAATTKSNADNKSDWGGGLSKSADNPGATGESGMTTTGLFGDGSIVSIVINTILYIIGIISVIMLIVGGIQYATSSGDEKKVTTAKNTIIYAIVGLVIAILAWTLVNFVFTAFDGE